MRDSLYLLKCCIDRLCRLLRKIEIERRPIPMNFDASKRNAIYNGKAMAIEPRINTGTSSLAVESNAAPPFVTRTEFEEFKEEFQAFKEEFKAFKRTIFAMMISLIVLIVFSK